MLFRRKGIKIYIFRKSIDMRCGFNKLTSFVRDTYSMQVLLDGHVFVFFGKNRHRIKIFFFDGSGVCLLTKRIEQGRFMSIEDLDVESVDFLELERLIHGSVLRHGSLGKMPKGA